MDSLLTVSLKVPISYQAGEELAVGLLVSHDGKVNLRISDFKLSIAKKLIPAEAYTLLTEKLEMIKREFDNLSNQNLIGFDPSHSLLSDQYLKYLSKYSNNALRFDIDEVKLAYSEKVFDLLFARYVTEIGDKPHIKKTVSVKSWVKSKLKPKINERVTWDVVIDHGHLDSLIFPEIKFDFAGKNGKLVVGQALDFEKEYKVVRNELATLYTFSQNKKDVSKTYVIGKEPKKSTALNHELWTQFRALKSVTMVNGSSELGQIHDYLEEKGVRPYLER
jgi:hypothetical protein